MSLWLSSLFFLLLFLLSSLSMFCFVDVVVINFLFVVVVFADVVAVVQAKRRVRDLT